MDRDVTDREGHEREPLTEAARRCGEGDVEVRAQITVRPLVASLAFTLQWDDQIVSRDQGLALFDALASAEKTLHVNPGKHGDVPPFEADNSLRFFARHLS
ncbi:hypothetical protein ACIBF5_30200 [Micromonospora sp. NPDC050417]|uniref:hypothetical protein n=1 Tax=Micromonospora sp. NPDC050417 TaxID=3364280 RepID=UPI0037B62B9C